MTESDNRIEVLEATVSQGYANGYADRLARKSIGADLRLLPLRNGS
jgi:hypothetical protein